MHKVRESPLVLCVDVSECVGKYANRTLEDIIAIERKRGGLDYLLCEPFMTSERRSLYTRPPPQWWRIAITPCRKYLNRRSLLTILFTAYPSLRDEVYIWCLL